MIEEIQNFLKCFGAKKKNNSTSASPEPYNLDLLKNEIKAYYDNGAYAADVKSKVVEAMGYISNEKKINSIIVLDIDDTCTSTYDFCILNDFAWTEELIDQSNSMSNFPVIKSTLDLFNWCKVQQLTIYIISSKREKYRSAATELLANAGYAGYVEMILRPDDDHSQTIAQYKYNERAKLIAQGFEIICNVGDQVSDFATEAGGNDNALHSIKLPNPLYYIDYTI